MKQQMKIIVSHARTNPPGSKLVLQDEENQLMTSEHSFINESMLTTNRIKRKTSLTNSQEINPTVNKKLDVVKAIEFNEQFDRENDSDDYADRIFNYLSEACTQQSPANEIKHCSPPPLPVQSSDNEIKSFQCTFCPYVTRNFSEFQSHIAKHTEKNFRCLLCNCMYKYRRDCVTHMKRKHSNTVTGSISQYIQKLNDLTRNMNSIQPSSSTPNNFNSVIEPKRYGCPYCSLMTKSTSSIYKHQSRKHASFPKLVHKYSTDDPNTRSLVAILKQKSIKKPIVSTEESSINGNDLPEPSNVSSSSSFTQQQTDSLSVVNRHRCAASKHVIAHQISSSTGRQSKIFQCCLCGYRAHHRSNVVRHVKKIHTIDVDESHHSPNTNNTESILIENLPLESMDHQSNDTIEQLPNYSLNTTVQAPLIVHHAKDSNASVADIHLSINIFLPKKFIRTASDCSQSEEKHSDDDFTDSEETTKIQITSSPQINSLYKPHKCRRCFYRSNWKTDMLHHIRLKHQIDHATKSDYLSMDVDSALRSFTNYEQTFGKVLKNRLLLPKIDYINCTWEELKMKLSLPDLNQSSSSPTIEDEISKKTTNDRDKILVVDNEQNKSNSVNIDRSNK